MKSYQRFGTAITLLGALAFAPTYAAQAKPSATVQSEEKPSVAILNFKYNSKERPNVEDMLATDLARFDCISLHERANLQSILKEMKIGMTGVVDEKTAVKVGKVAGVEKIILGAYTLADNNARIDIRYIDVATGKVELTESVIGDAKDLSLVDSLSSRLSERLCKEPLPPQVKEDENPISRDEGPDMVSAKHEIGNDVYSFPWHGKEITITPIEKCPQFVKVSQPDRFPESERTVEGLDTDIEREPEIKQLTLDFMSVSYRSTGIFTVNGRPYIELGRCPQLASTIISASGLPSIDIEGEAPPADMNDNSDVPLVRRLSATTTGGPRKFTPAGAPSKDLFKLNGERTTRTATGALKRPEIPGYQEPEL